jgi:hypothetical protein
MAITIGSLVWGYYSGAADNGQAGEYRGVVRQIRNAEDGPEYFVEYEDGIGDWTSRVREQS